LRVLTLSFVTVFGSEIRDPGKAKIAVFRIHVFLGLPDPDPLVGGMDPDPALDPDPSIIIQK
jgi:hypothetical protein